MLKPTTKIIKESISKTPSNDKITVKKRVESPIIMAKVPIIEARSLSKALIIDQNISAIYPILYPLPCKPEFICLMIIRSFSPREPKFGCINFILSTL
jgi:hypothetical protein